MKLSGLLLPFAFVLGSLAACGDDGGSTPLDADNDAPPNVDAATDAPIDAPIPIPAFRNPVDMTDLELARAAALRLGVGSSENCDGCHALTNETFQRWLTETTAADACFTTLTPTSAAQAKGLLDCFRSATGEPYDPNRLGIYTTGAGLAWFDAITKIAYGSQAETEWAEWTERVRMPCGTAPLFTQADFDIVAEWFARRLPQLNVVLNDIPPPEGCTEMISPDIATHVTAMQTQGWEALNREDGITMFGCASASTPLDCLSTYPLSTANSWSARWGEAAPSAKLRILHQYNYRSSFWTRSSADGRYVAHGGGPGGSTFIDLQRAYEIPSDAAYDPGFFPDNSGFVMQGGNRPWCRQSLLNANPTQITFNEALCSSVSVVSLYQHLGAVRGGDYWAVAGQFVSDSGGGEPGSNFSASSRSDLTPMIWNGTNYVPRTEISIATPFEGDTIMSPSAKLLLSRKTFMGQQAGFSVRKLNAVPNGNTYDVTVPVVAEYCVRGGKPAYSYDERWITYHHWVEAGDWQALGYASATDPEFVARRQAGTANVFMIDSLTGVSIRVTHMNPGQSALFPHFRSDGWLYFIVKDDATPNHEVVVASDAALVYE